MRLSFPRTALMALGVAAGLTAPRAASAQIGIDLYQKADSAYLAGRWDAARSAYNDAVRTSDLSPAQIAFAWYRLGSVNAHLDDRANAIASFSRAIELNNKYGAAWAQRGYTRSLQGQYDSADADFQKAIGLAADQTWDGYLPWLYGNYAELWRRRGQFDQALTYTDKALDAKKPDPSAYFRRASIYLDMGRTADAKAEFAKFLAATKGTTYQSYWPDELATIERLRSLP